MTARAKSQVFDLFDLTSFIAFMKIIKSTFDTSVTQRGTTTFLFQLFMNKLAAATLWARLSADSIKMELRRELTA